MHIDNSEMNMYFFCIIYFLIYVILHSAQNFSSPVRPVMFPARGIKQVPQLTFPVRSPSDVADDGDQLVKSDLEQVVGMDIFRDAIYRFFFLRLVGAKQVVPDHKDAPVIFVEILQVGGMVHPVVAGELNTLSNHPSLPMISVCGQYW